MISVVLPETALKPRGKAYTRRDHIASRGLGGATWRSSRLMTAITLGLGFLVLFWFIPGIAGAAGWHSVRAELEFAIFGTLAMTALGWIVDVLREIRDRMPQPDSD
jgi:hypothetical protein